MLLIYGDIRVRASSIRLKDGELIINCIDIHAVDILESLGFVRETPRSYTLIKSDDIPDFYFSY